MANTTTNYWSVIPDDGVEYSLQTYAKNIESWGNSRNSAPPVRGEDTVIPWLVGRQEEIRVPDSDTLTLAMWVIGNNDAGTLDAGVTGPRDQFERNWNMLRRILWNYGRVFLLGKRFNGEGGGNHTAYARARFAEGLELGMIGDKGGRFTVDLYLADPFFYNVATTNISITSGVNSTPSISGTQDARKITFAGVAGGSGCTNPSFTCLENGHSWSVNNVFAAGDHFNVDFANQICTDNGGNDISGLVNHSGSNDWFKLPPIAPSTTCTIVPTASVGAFTGTMPYFPTWI